MITLTFVLMDDFCSCCLETVREKEATEAGL